ncbi:MAG: hypothetical protein AB7S36_12230 [Planctomycetota bacterium]
MFLDRVAIHSEGPIHHAEIHILVSTIGPRRDNNELIDGRHESKGSVNDRQLVKGCGRVWGGGSVWGDGHHILLFDRKTLPYLQMGVLFVVEQLLLDLYAETIAIWT